MEKEKEMISLLTEIRDLLREEKEDRKKAWDKASAKMAEQEQMMEQTLAGLPPQFKAMFSPPGRKVENGS